MRCGVVQKQVTIARSSLEACKNKEAIVIATEWKEFREIEWQTVYDHMNKPAFVFDGRMIVDADALKKIGFKVCFFRPYLSFPLRWVLTGGFAGQGNWPR